MRIDGHTDERGSREYNIGLGERRANAVRNVMVLKGVSEDRIVTVSYGKEKPIALGHAEESWQQNRRAEFAYEGQE
jgi:peptidoglycan-associated lipoprotein